MVINLDNVLYIDIDDILGLAYIIKYSNESFKNK